MRAGIFPCGVTFKHDSVVHIPTSTESSQKSGPSRCEEPLWPNWSRGRPPSGTTACACRPPGHAREGRPTPTRTARGSGCPATQATFLLPQESSHCRGVVEVLQARCILNAAALLHEEKSGSWNAIAFCFTFLDGGEANMMIKFYIPITTVRTIRHGDSVDSKFLSNLT